MDSLINSIFGQIYKKHEYIHEIFYMLKNMYQTVQGTQIMYYIFKLFNFFFF